MLGLAAGISPLGEVPVGELPVGELPVAVSALPPQSPTQVRPNPIGVPGPILSVSAMATPPHAPSVQTVIFYSPHADDETLSMGEPIARYGRAHWRVEVVVVTDGADSGARVGINRVLRREGLPMLSIPAFVAARYREFEAALAQLGVSATHVHIAGWHGDHLTIAEAEATIRGYAARFPGALHVTMSVIDRNPDHRALGFALAALAPRLAARWVIFPRYWRATEWAGRCSVFNSPATVAAVEAAGAIYGHWGSAHGWYAVGTWSVIGDFRALRADPRDLLCTTATVPVRPGSGLVLPQASATGT